MYARYGFLLVLTCYACLCDEIGKELYYEMKLGDEHRRTMLDTNSCVKWFINALYELRWLGNVVVGIVVDEHHEKNKSSWLIHV